MLRVHENSSISTRIIIKLMLGKWVTNRWARFGCLAYCQYTFMLYSLFSPFIRRARSMQCHCYCYCSFCSCVSWWWVFFSLILLLSYFTHIHSIFCFRVLCFRCISPGFFFLIVFIILLFNFLLLVLQPLILIVLLMSYMLLFRFVSLGGSPCERKPDKNERKSEARNGKNENSTKQQQQRKQMK